MAEVSDILRAAAGLDPRFQDSLTRMIAAAPPEIRSGLTLNSGFRDNKRQGELYDAAIAKYGSPEAARKWVAPPGRSQHNHGTAGDLGFANDATRQWVHANAGNYGLTFPMQHEPWHIEPVGARSGVAPALANAPTSSAPQMAPSSGAPMMGTAQPQMMQQPLQRAESPLSDVLMTFAQQMQKQSKPANAPRQLVYG